MQLDDAKDEVFAVRKLRDALAEVVQWDDVTRVAFSERGEHLSHAQIRALRDAGVNLQNAIRRYKEFVEDVDAVSNDVEAQEGKPVVPWFYPDSN